MFDDSDSGLSSEAASNDTNSFSEDGLAWLGNAGGFLDVEGTEGSEDDWLGIGDGLEVDDAYLRERFVS